MGLLHTSGQGMSCEGACAHAHVRCAVARVRDVRAALFLMCDRTFAHFLEQN